MFIQLNVFRQTAVSRCEGFPPFQGMTDTLKMGTQSVPETSENLHILMWLSAREYSFELCHHRSFNTYNNVHF